MLDSKAWEDFKIRFGGGEASQYVTIQTEQGERKPICSMWDPIVAPSFDEEGRQRYLCWLEKRYGGEIAAFNAACDTNAESFEALTPCEYWFACRYPDDNGIEEEEIKKKTAKCRVMMDNRLWQSEELVLYFAEMAKKLKAVEPDFYLCPNLAQWGYFLNVDGGMLSGVGMADLWDTAVRGIDELYFELGSIF